MTEDSDFRLVVEQRDADGEWRAVDSFAVADLSPWQCAQLAVLLSDIDLATYATMPAGAQARVLLDALIEKRNAVAKQAVETVGKQQAER